MRIYDDVSNRPVWWLDIISFKKRFYLATTACSNLPLLNMCRILLTSRSPSHTMCASPAIFPAGFRKEHVAGGKNKFYPQYFVTIRRYYHIFFAVGGRKQKRGEFTNLSLPIVILMRYYCRKTSAGPQLSK